MGRITIEGKPVTVSDDFFKLSPEEQDATVEEIAAEMGASSAPDDNIPDRSFSELPGNIVPDAVNTVTGLVEMIKHPEPMIEAMQGGVDRGLDWLVSKAEATGSPALRGLAHGYQDLNNTLDYLSPRTPERKEANRELAGQVGQQLKHDYGGLKNIKNTIITRPVSSALDIASLAAPILGTANKLRTIGGGARAVSPTEVLGVGRPAVTKLAAAVKGDRLTSAQVSELGPEGMVMDAGPNLRKQARGVFIHQGEGSQVVDEALKRRAEGTTARALNAADDAMGPRVNAVEKRDRLKQARAGHGKQNYGPVFENAKAVNTNPVVEAIDDVIAPSIAGKGPDALSESGKRLSRYRDRLINSRGQVTEAKALQSVYIDLGDDIGEAVRAGRGGEAGRLIEIKKKLEASIDEATQGGFSKANAEWATDSEIMEAFGFGEDLAKNSLTPDEVAARLKTMKPEARAQVLPGLRNWVYEVVGTARNDAAAARALLQRGWTQEKLAMVLGKDKAAELARRIGLERTYAETDQFVRRGSNTAPGQSGAADVADQPILNGNREAYVNAGFTGVARKTALNVIDGVLKRLASHRGEVTRADLGKMLTASGAQRDEIVRLLTDPKTMEAFKAGGLPARTLAVALRGFVTERALEKVQPANR